jgi:tetratricopeptide (TPR) repeat protein
VAGGRTFLAGVLDRDAAPSHWRALVLYADGLLAFRQGDMAASLARNEEALAMARTLGDAEAESYALVGLSRVALRAGEHAQVVRLAQQARALVDDPAAAAAPLHLHAAGTRLLGDYDGAKALYEESLELARTSGDSRMETMELHNLGHVELHRGDVAAAERLFAEWRTRVESSADPYDAAMRSLNDAALAIAHGDRERAHALLDEAEGRLAAAGIVLDPDDAAELELLRHRDALDR